MGLKLITAPAEEAVTLAQAKLQNVEDSDAFDAQFSSIWIPSAREQAEHRTARKFVTQTWRLTLDAFPCDVIDLPYPPLQSVDHIKYFDADGVLQTLAADQYQVVTDEITGRLYPAYGLSWPVAREQPGSVQIQFIVGYGNADAVPQSLKNWMLLAIATWYRNRESIITGTIVEELPRDFCAGLLDKYVIESLR